MSEMDKTLDQIENAMLRRGRAQTMDRLEGVKDQLEGWSPGPPTAKTKWQTKFPSHLVMDKGELSEIYDKLSKYYRELSRDKDPMLKAHMEALGEGLSALNSARLKLHDAELALYR